MARSDTTEPCVPLLRGIVDLFLLGAEHFVGESYRARSARKRLQKKDPDDGAYFANLCEDLKLLAATLHGIPDTWANEPTGQQAILHVLTVVQTDFVKHADEKSDSGEKTDDESDEFKQYLFSPLRAILSGRLEDNAKEEDKICWFCERIEFEKTRSTHRKSLLEAIGRCNNALKGLNGSRNADMSWQRHEPSTTLWSTPLFVDAEAYHETLSDQWKCDCFDNRLHQKAVFSFNSSEEPQTSTLRGAILFPDFIDDTYVWKLIRYEYQQKGSRLRD